jgi:mannan endo-1,4-beta-mannosidase
LRSARDVHRSAAVPASGRGLSGAGALALALTLTLSVALGSCIKRTAPPATAAGGGAPGDAAGADRDAAAAAALEAANARIADRPRVALVAGDWTKSFTVQGEAKKADAAPLPVTGQPFADAMRLTVKEGSQSPWGVQLVASTGAPVAANDAILATFFLRTETPQEGSVGETEFVFELGQAPYSKSVSYPIQAGPGWTKVQIRFQADRAFAAGEAHMIFRLGYEPETLDIGGVRVESFGHIAIGELPSTQGADRRRERAFAAAAKQAESQAVAQEGGELHFQVEPAHVIRTISPFVYGINSQKEEGTGATVRRMGGNRQSAYNWEINASNAGSDYEHSSDDWPCTVLNYTDCSQPGAQFIDFANENHKAGMESLVTIPLIDFVAADKSGAVAEKDKAPSKRWNRSFAKKPGAFTATPDRNDGKVYEDEFVNLLVSKLGKASAGGIKFYSLDNEPALWPSTHPRVHPEKTTYAEMVARSELTADAITGLDPSAFVLGGVMFGWSEYMSLSSAPDSKENNVKYGSYVDFYLASMKKLEERHHRRLVHALDIHWYPESRGTKRITEKDTSGKTITARLQAPRSLWDPTYTEKSWITAEWGKPIRLIPWLEERIAERYPGTKLAMTEYNFGAGDHISGGLAQAEVLGVLGREGVYLATYWGDGPGNGDLPKFIKPAFKLYRNYDGKKGAFGDTAVVASGNLDKSSIFAATDSKRPGVLTVLVINKELHTSFDGRIDLKGGGYKKAQAFVLDASSSDVRAQPAVEIKNDQLAYRLPALSATLFVCER